MDDRPMVAASALADLRPGDIGFGPIRGGAGLLVNAGQLILGEGFRVGRLDIRHVFVVTEARPNRNRYCVEAMPSGAREMIISNRWTPDHAYVRLPEDYPGQAADAAAIARAMVGTPYSFASYLALAAWRFKIRTPRLEKWIGRRRPHQPILDYVGKQQVDLLGSRAMENPMIALPAEAICSVLADQAWSLAGKRIMHGTAPQAVTPGALALRLLEMASERPDAVWTFPGRG